MIPLDLQAHGVIYTVADDGVSLEAKCGRNHPVPRIHRMDHAGKTTLEDQIMVLNRTVRRACTMLHAGNLPLLAMGSLRPSQGNDPPPVKLGELAFSAITGSGRYPFCDADEIKATHLPNGTRWEIRFNALPGTVFHLYASLLEDQGIAVTLRVENCPGTKIEVTAGNYRVASRHFTAEWYGKDSRRFSPELHEIRRGQSESGFYAAADLSEPSETVGKRFSFTFVTKNKPELSDSKGELTASFDGGEGLTFALAGAHAPLGQPLPFEEAEKSFDWIVSKQKASEEYFRRLLDGAAVDSGDKTVDCGIANAILSLEYCYTGDAWLEGGHWWNCHWTNNFQISAAVALGQYERAKKALLYFGLNEEGYNPVSLLGNVIGRRKKKDGSDALGYDGIPYYLHQLWQYTEATGDLSVVRAVAGNVDAICRDMTGLCDPDHDGLYSFHRGCNSFLYQADHFAVPGAGVSPSIMISHGFDVFSQLLRQIGREETSRYYEEQSLLTKRKVDAVLWNAQKGFYDSMVDLNGDRIDAHYYTDLVFPALYGGGGDRNRLLPLLHLKDALLTGSGATGKKLMRVGKHKPDLFGNNNVMPVQMSEAAMALFEAGDYETAYDLIDSCALANSIFTESPGSSPERLSDLGKGEANYMFGNPAAALCLAAVSGMAGLNVCEMGECLRFSPSFPFAKKEWSVKLPYAAASCSETRDGQTYGVTLPGDTGIRRIGFSVCLPVSGEIRMLVNGAGAEFELSPALYGTRVSAVIPAAGGETKIALAYRSAPIEFPQRAYAACGEKLNLVLAKAEEIVEGQPEFFDDPGEYNILVLNKTAPAYVNFPVTVYPKPSVVKARFEDGRLSMDGFGLPHSALSVEIFYAARSLALQDIEVRKDGSFHADMEAEEPDIPAVRLKYRLSGPGGEAAGELSAPVASERMKTGEPVDLEKLYNADSIHGVNRWRNGPFSVELSEGRKVKLAVIEKGRSNEDFGEIEASPYPDTLSVPVGKRCRAISLLYASETDVRLTGQKLGGITLRYADRETRIPLVAGKNAGSIFSNYAADTIHIPVADSPGDSVNRYDIGCDETSRLEQVEIKITKEDAGIGLIAVSCFE